MAMTIPLPTRQILALFQQNNTEALWMDYDKDADALYVNFQRPATADHSEMTEDDTVLRYQGDRIIGFTILNASTRE
jgi:uncharacterized protein YuzE